MSRAAADALASWDGDGRVFELFGRMLSHPRFGAAVRTTARAMLDLSAADPALDAVFKDAGRYMVAAWSMYLAAADELTLPRLKAIGIRSGMLSPGRVRLLMQFLEHLGYLRVVEPGRGRRSARYAPTIAFDAAWRLHHRTAFAAAVLVEPAAHDALALFDDPVLYARFCRAHAETLLDGADGGVLDAPFFQILYHSHAGIQLVWSLLAAMEDEGFPPRTPLRFSAIETARRFAVSPAHIRRVLASAEAAGLIRRDGDGAVTLSDDTNLLLGMIYAGQLIALLGSAGQALRAER